MGWQPLLKGGLKDQALERVAAIREGLSTRQRDLDDSPSLANGTAGLAILYGCLAQAEGGPGHAAEAIRCLCRATVAVTHQPGSASLYGGLTGLGWALAHWQGRLPGLDGEEELAEIDQLLLENLEQSPWPETYDLIDGLVGFGVYALERLGNGAGNLLAERPEGCFAPNAADPVSQLCLERVIERLAETAEHGPDGITWVSCQEWLPANDRDHYPARYYNLGLAYGVPGVVALLARACAAGVAVARARPLLEGTVRWLLAQQTPGGFPSGIALEKADEPARLAGATAIRAWRPHSCGRRGW
jgi:hypothetical protein